MMTTRSKFNNKDFMIVDDKAPFILLTDFVKRWGIESDYRKGVLWLNSNVDSLSLSKKNKSELRKIINNLITFDTEGK